MDEEDTAIFHGGDAVRFTVIVFLGRLWQTGQKIGISAGAALTVLEGEVERGVKLEPPLDSRIVVSTLRAPCDPRRCKTFLPQR